ncbi:very-long-chain enoyl-CoA reductase-like [Sinocyclocheilus anshuiensis]|uniref:very-long-chain enoyl-CoA reductase-like n=1 Tax=Sinocyclocheilus anshuiensis TaxID=1608454 RepID=UPI0007BABC6D|nr:PREDICTED: very-long-chain enoyl-CoA reductase-like [Sinocyclocheilus anshuiensis]
MQCVDLRNLFAVAQFIKARCDHGLKAGLTENKNYVFFEVEILDLKSKAQLCYLDKVEPNATIAEIKTLLHKIYPKFYPSRQALKLHPEGKALSDDDVLEDLPVGTTATMFFQDLGPQLGWTMVFLAECLGPLFIYLLFYYRLPYIYGHEYDYTQSPFKVVNVAFILHRCFSSSYLFVHFIQVCEFGHFSVHLILNRISCNGSRPKEIPYPTNNPFTWLFFFVSCPNYTYEVGSWISFTAMTQCVPVGVFAFLGFIQMTIWARAKHKTYTEQFKYYPDLRTAIIPLFF